MNLEATENFFHNLQIKPKLNDVIAIDDYLEKTWGITSPINFNKREEIFLKLAGEKLYARIGNINSKRSRYQERRREIPKEIDTPFYDAVANEKISGFIHSEKHAYILDCAVILLHLIAHLKPNKPVVDIGCNIGYHCHCISTFLGVETLGLDPSANSIRVAKEKTGYECKAKFIHGTEKNLPNNQNYDFIFSFDSIELAPHTIIGISNKLINGGVWVTTFDDHPDNLAKLKSNLQASNLGFGFLESYGGFLGDDFDGKVMLGVIKGGTSILPENPAELLEAKWKNFQAYANNVSTNTSKKTFMYSQAD